MLQVARWVRILVAAILIGGFLIALPNVLPDSVRNRLPALLQNTVSLGLDLQGGSYLLLEVDIDQVQKDRLESLMGDIRVGLRKAHIAFNGMSSSADSVSVHVIDPTQFENAKSILQNLNPLLGTSMLAVGTRQYDVAYPGNGIVAMKVSEAYKRATKDQILDQEIEVVRKRIDALGTREPTIQRQGEERILVQVPGLSDPQRLIQILGKTAKMTFQLVDESADVGQVLATKIVPIGDELLPDVEGGPVPQGAQQRMLVVQRRIMVAGDRLQRAAAQTNQQTGQWVVTFGFDSVGAREFGDVTKENVGRRFAIVLDKQIISAPVIREPILGGSGEIEGNFTIEAAQNLSVLINAGALPAALKVIEQRTVGAELGADAVKAGRYSALAGLVLVALFMFARYGLFGVFADLALTLNVVLLIAILTLFQATLTLPGIAGIVLTMGMAVDANVLIYERIREEQRNGRSMLASIDTGFRLAMNTIIDANATHLIASLILFELGSGPVRGFAVTLGVGIITSFFTAVMVTRLIVLQWLRIARPKQLAI
jgi:protein-export membrane protein SecD